MRKPHAFIAALAIQILFANSAQAFKIVYTCRSEQGVGFNSGNLSPTTFNALDMRLYEYPHNNGIGLEVLYKGSGWVHIGDTADGKDNEYFIHIPGIMVGSYFGLNIETGRFTFSNASDYIRGKSSSPHMYVGFCKKQ